jgi:phenylacetate-coenzyme A ligase PaaK-like adenylate-forming protein
VSESVLDILSVTSENFEAKALQVFEFQYSNVTVYRQFCQLLKRTPVNVHALSEIPFLPVDFFKTHQVLAEGKNAEVVFESSRTTGSVSSKHFVADTNIYEQSFIHSFERFYGSINDFVILALLPSYLERGNSSLVYMARQMMALTEKADSGFFLNDFEKLRHLLIELKLRKQKTILLGVTFALLDFAEAHPLSFPELIVMETGGMKGRRKELTRAEVHQRLCAAFEVPNIHSEYGMTELLSQAYSKGRGVFNTPPWMKIVLRDVADPLTVSANTKTGAVNVIDLANIYSCSFIATGDMGRVNEDGSFEIAGRLDNVEIRGCNLMVP